MECPRTLVCLCTLGLVLALVSNESVAHTCAPHSFNGAAFTYQGRFEDASGPVDGSCDPRFGLPNAASGGGYTPAWSPDGSRLYYMRQGSLWEASVVAGSCRTENHRLVFSEPQVPSDLHQRNWDVLPDGSGFVVVDRSRLFESKARQIHVVLDWFEYLEKVVDGS